MKIPRLVSVGGKLALICAVAAVLLALVNAVTAPVIVENKARALREGLLAVANQARVGGLTLGEQSTVADVDQVAGLFPARRTSRYRCAVPEHFRRRPPGPTLVVR